MSKRIARVNELLQREISGQLHRHYRGEAVGITISGVETVSDLRHARVYYSVLGGDEERVRAESLFRRVGGDLRHRVGKEVVLKYLPHLEFRYDPSFARAADIMEILDEIDNEHE